MLALALAQWDGVRVSADVALGADGAAAEPVVGSFTVDGLTYAVAGDGQVALVAARSQAGAAAAASSALGAEGQGQAEDGLAVPALVTFGGVGYEVVAIGPHAFAACEALTVALPATVTSVDPRAFRATMVQRVEADPSNPAYSSYDGALYSADGTRLLLVPGGRQGAVRILSHAEAVEPGALSHGAAVTSFSVDEGSAAFSAWDGLLYTADGTTLVAVPAGATEITIHEGCLSVAPGALAGCVKLRSIHAPATVTSISPDLFEDASVGDDGGSSGDAPSDTDGVVSNHVMGEGKPTSLVAVRSAMEEVMAASPQDILVALSVDAAQEPWISAGFKVEGGFVVAATDGHEEASTSELVTGEKIEEGAEGGKGVTPSEEKSCVTGLSGLIMASLSEGSSARANKFDLTLNAGGGTIYATDKTLTKLTRQNAPASVTCGCSYMKARVLPDYSGAIHFRHGSTQNNHKYFLWVRPGYKVVGFMDVRNNERFDLTTTLQPMSNKPRTLEPIWEPRSYTIFLEPGAGEVISPNMTGSSATTMVRSTFTYRAGMRFSEVPELDRLGKNGMELVGFDYNCPGVPAPANKTIFNDLSGHYKVSDPFQFSDEGDIAAARGYPTYLTCRWGKTITLTWDGNGGTPAEKTNTSYITENSRGKLDPPQSPTLAGKQFLGWRTSPSGTGTYVDGTTPCPYTNTRFYAFWTQPTFTIQYRDYNGNLLTTSSFNPLNHPVKLAEWNSGWGAQGDYQGWSRYAQSSDMFMPFGGSTTLTQNPGTLNLYLCKGPAAVFIKYYDVGGSVIAEDWGREGDSFALLAESVLSDPPLGRHYAGWLVRGPTGTVDKGFGGHYTITMASLIPNKTIEIRPNVARSKYTIEYKTHSGGSMYATTAYCDADVTLGSPSGTTGYVGTGWSRTKGAAVPDYASRATVPPLTRANGARIELFSTVRPVQYEVVYLDTNDAELLIQGAQYDESFELATSVDNLTVPNGYDLSGWSTSKHSTTGTYRLGATVRNLASTDGAQVKLYPVFSGKSYTVSFDANGGLGGQSADATATFGSDMPKISTTAPTLTGYTFQGWWDTSAATGGKQYYNAQGASVNKWDKASNTTLYARWSGNKYTITFAVSTEWETTRATAEATYGSRLPSVPLTLKGHAGYTFDGWFDSENTTSRKQYYDSLGSPLLPWDKTNDATLYASYTGNEYTVRLMVEKPANYPLDILTARFGSDMPKPNISPSTKLGYSFRGWFYVSASGKETQYYNPDLSSTRPWGEVGDKDLYQRWTPNTYNVAYHTSNGELLGSDPWTYDAYSLLRGNPGVTHEAYTAKGWATSPNQAAADHAFAAMARNFTAEQGATFDLFVAEEANEYQISYDVQGGSLEGQKTTYTVETPSFQLAEPKRAGYTFLGWEVTGAQGAGVLEEDVRSTVLQGTWGDLACVAQWRSNEYEVTLDAAFRDFALSPLYEEYAGHGVNKGEGTASVAATFDAPMPAVVMPRATGYTFQGYFDEKDGAGTKYYEADGSSAHTWNHAGNATLYAHWTVDRYELTLDVGNGEVPSAASRGWSRDEGEAGLYRLGYSIEYYEESGGSPRVQLPAPATKPGYASFEGWVGPNLSSPSTVVQVHPWELASKAYTGVFANPTGYTASLDLDGGSFAAAPEGWAESAGVWARGFTVESEAFALPVPTRAGHDFLGWALVGADGSLGAPDGAASVPGGTWGDRLYRAVWEACGYTITWDYAGHAIDGELSATAAQLYGRPIAFPSRPSEADPARDHYSFSGWFTQAEGGERVEAGDYLLESDATFYARWEPVEYVAHLHMDGGHMEQGGLELPMAPDGHFDISYTVEDEVVLPTLLGDATAPKPVRPGMEFKGWVPCDSGGSYDEAAVPPSLAITLPVGSHGERHFRAVWSFVLRFEVPSAIGFRLDLAGDPAFADIPYGPVTKVEGADVELRSLSAAPLCVADLAVDVAHADPDAIVTDRSKVSLRVMDAGLPEPWVGWMPLPTTSAPEHVDRFDLPDLGFGAANAIAPLSSKPLRYEIEVHDPTTTLAGEVSDLPLAQVVFTVAFA